ncbi:hypothetical protein OC844_004607 [Tilletia horrida]|nr:hypothetical protein OC844_004607 [Tilletia horrida]
MAMPATGAQRRVEVTFDSAEAYLAVRDVNIYWKHQRAKVVSRGPALGARYRLVTAHVPTHNGTSVAVQAFADSCGPAIEIDHLWLTHSGPEGRPETATWTGHIVALLHLEGPDHLEQTPLSFSDLLKFPGFTRMDGRDYEVLFAGRPNYCRICRHRTDPFHTTDVCPTRMCPACGGPKHGSDHCPYSDEPEDDGSDTSSGAAQVHHHDDTTSDHEDDSQPPAGTSSVAPPASPPPPRPLPTAPITRSRTGTALSSSSSGTSSLARSRSETDLARPRSGLVAAAAPLHKDADEHPSAPVPPTSNTTAAGNITAGTLPAGAGSSLSPDANMGTASLSAAQTASPARPYGTLVADLASRISARPPGSLKPKSMPKGKGKGKAKSKAVDEHQLPIDAFYAAEPGRQRLGPDGDTAA